MLMVTLGTQKGLCHVYQKRKGVLDGWHNSKLIAVEYLILSVPSSQDINIHILTEVGDFQVYTHDW